MSARRFPESGHAGNRARPPVTFRREWWYARPMKQISALSALRTSLALPVLALLAACGQDDAAEDAAGTEQIEVDPARFGTVDTSPEAVEAARQAAVQLVGGTDAMREAPQAREIGGELPADAVLSQATQGAATGTDGTDCGAIAEYSESWAGRLPAGFPLYPESQVIEAAGTDASGCSLRVVNFASPVTVKDVMDFYYTRAVGEGFEIQRAAVGGEDTLGGTGAGGNFLVVGRDRPGGGSDIDLIVSGR